MFRVAYCPIPSSERVIASSMNPEQINTGEFGWSAVAGSPRRGAVGEVRVIIEGRLELGTDEDERLVAHVLARRGLRALSVTSGGNYAFNDLDPGDYRMTFWYWRLGSLERSVKLLAGHATRVDEVLSVDRTVR